ncbi:MAG TPA: ACP S-malonyltransferase [bacterium]|nr:ACP S-malonyltransferase [bacterium]
MIEKRIGVVFPGQGSQYVGMGKDLYDKFEIVREIFDTGSEICGFDIASACFEGPIEHLTDTKICQVCVFTVAFACWKLIQQMFTFSPVFVAGHSLGEYTAFTAAEAISLEDAFTLISKRAEFMKDATIKNPGGMIAVMGKTFQEIEKALANFNGIYISNINHPGQIVVGGSKSGIQSFTMWCKENHIRIIPLNVSGAFHTPLMEPAAEKLAEEIDKTNIKDCRFPVYVNYNGEMVIHTEQIRDALKKQIIHPVQWVKIIEVCSSFVDLIIECGPKKVLSALITKIKPGIQVCNIEDIATLNRAIEIMRSPI